MKRKTLSMLALLAFSLAVASAANYQWTNTLGGSWHVAANWSPNFVPGASDKAVITNSGTYTITITSAVPATSFDLGNSSGTQTLVVDKGVALNLTSFGTVFSGGVLVATNCSLAGGLTIQPGGQLTFAGPVLKTIYSLNLTNLGTVLWSGGPIQFGSLPITSITNGGLWQITGDDFFSNGGGSGSLTPNFFNGGIIRKSGGTGQTIFTGWNFVNAPGALVDVLSGTLLMSSSLTNQIIGSFTSTAPGTISLYNGFWTDAGGTFSGTGTNQLNGGTLNLRTNTVPGLKLVSGNVVITSSNLFQAAGVITNLTLDGATLLGTNTLNNGTITMTSGSFPGQLTILPAGQFVLASPVTKLLYSATIINQGTVTWTDGGLNFGTTTISNGGLWQITSTNNIAANYGGGAIPVWTNSGTLKKIVGTNTAQLNTMYFYNQPGGLVQVDSGTLQLPAAVTNATGNLRVNGGTLIAGGTLTVSGGTLDGAGNFGANNFTGGNISPGQVGAGQMNFSAGLNLNSNVTLTIDGSGTVPGTSYDQLSVTGAVTLANCNLQITSLPVVPAGTTFVLINNDAADAVIGTFNGLPENSLFNVGAQPFRIHYAGGTGNDVTLVRNAGPPTLASAGLTNGVWNFTGVGTPSGIYAIQATTNFITWTNLGFATGDVSGNISFTDTNAFHFKYRFYRTTN